MRRDVVMDVWKSDGGDEKLTLLTKWRQAALAANPSVNTSPNALVATIDGLYGDLTAEQKSDWDSEKSDVQAALSELASVLAGQTP